MVERCQGKTKEGKPCSATPRPGSTWCPWHDPSLAAERSRWSAKGGAMRSNYARAKKNIPAEPLSNAEVHAYMSLAFRRTLAGKMEPGILNALSQAGRAIADLSKVVDFEEQLATMRREIVDLSERRNSAS